MGDYIEDPYPYAKFHHDTITPVRPQICENAHQVTRLVSLVLPFAYTAKIAAPIFTINTSNDVVWRKDVPFGVPKTKFYISTPCPPKRKFIANFWRDKKILSQKRLNNGDAHL